MHLDKFRQYSGRLSSGETAISQPVILRLRREAIEIDAGLNMPEDSPVQHWAYARLNCGVPLTARSEEVLLSSTDHPGATLFVDDRDFAASLKHLAPQICARARRMIGLKPAGSITAVIAALAGLIYVTGYSPSKTIAGVMPERARALLGERVVSNMTKRFKHCSKPEGRRALDAMMKRLSDAAGLEKPFKVTVVNWHLVNAFAAPGGRLVLTKGLIQRAKSADMVAGVMAHEMGHGIERHPEAGLVRALALSTAGEFFFTGSSSSLKNIGLLLATLSFSRKAEAEADSHAVDILRKAGISQKPLAAFFRQMANRKGGSRLGKLMHKYKFLSTHPASLARAKLMEQQPDYAATPALNKKQWQALRAICGKRYKPLTRKQIAARNRRTVLTTTLLLTKHPENIKALKRRAKAYASLKQYSKAAKDYSRIIDLAPGKASHHLARANIYRYMKQWDNVIADYSQAIRIEPKKYFYYTYRARTYRKLRRYAKALADYNRAIELEPKNTYLYDQRAKLSIKMHNWDAAIADYSRSMTINPTESSFYIYRARARRGKGDYAGALADIDGAIKIYPKSAFAFMERGTTLSKLKKHEDAIAAFSKSISLSPRYVIAYVRRGQTYETVSDSAAAIKDYRKALQLKAYSSGYKKAQTLARARLNALLASHQ